jgi:hypothetical protein
MLVVHQLRFVLAFGGDAGQHLSEQGHAYLGFVLPFVGVALALVFAHFAVSVARRRGADAGPGAPGLTATWVASSVALLLAYGIQEGVEGTLAMGHPAGIAGIFGAGGWIAVPLAFLVGAVVALLLRGAASVLARVAVGPRGARPKPLRPGRRPPRRPELAPADPLACHLSGRAPPVLAY